MKRWWCSNCKSVRESEDNVKMKVCYSCQKEMEKGAKMEKENKVTFEEHQIVGMMAKIVQHKLSHEYCRVFNNAKTEAEGAKVSYNWSKALKFIEQFKCYAEEVMFKDFSELATTDSYYGARPEDLDLIKWLKEHLNETK